MLIIILYPLVLTLYFNFSFEIINCGLVLIFLFVVFLYTSCRKYTRISKPDKSWVSLEIVLRIYLEFEGHKLEIKYYKDDLSSH